MRDDIFLYAKFHVWCTKRDHLFRALRKTSHQSEFSLLHILEVCGSCCGTKTSIVLNDWCTSHGFNDKGAKEIKLIYFCNCFIVVLIVLPRTHGNISRQERLSVEAKLLACVGRVGRGSQMNKFE